MILVYLCQEVEWWLHHKACRRHDLESLVGVLQHAVRVIRPGRSFVQCMMGLFRGTRRPHYYIRLNQQFKADLFWWKSFAASWNGMELPPRRIPAGGVYVAWSRSQGSFSGLQAMGMQAMSMALPLRKCLLCSWL